MERKSRYRITSIKDENAIELYITESEYKLLKEVLSIFNNVIMENTELEPFDWGNKSRVSSRWYNFIL